MGSLFKRYRELVLTGLLLVIPLVVYASHAEVASAPGSLRRAVVSMTSPVQSGLTRAVNGVQDLWFGYVDLRGVRQQNLELRAELLRQRAAQLDLHELQSENERLRRLANHTDAAPEMRLLGATVISFGADSRFRTIRIGRGAMDGLRAGMPVISPDGVVGRLLNVYETVSDVLLITDPSSAVAVLSQRTRARATARGVSAADRLRLDYVIKSDDLEESDILVTAPSGGLFPKGLRIGRATRVNEAAHGLFKAAELVPFVDFGRLEEVQVVVDNGPSALLERPVTSLTQ